MHAFIKVADQACQKLTRHAKILRHRFPDMQTCSAANITSARVLHNFPKNDKHILLLTVSQLNSTICALGSAYKYHEKVFQQQLLLDT